MAADADPQSGSMPAREAETEAPSPSAHLETASWLRDHQGLIAIAVLFVIAVAMRRPLYMLRQVFWLDEAWVADSQRATLHALPQLTSSTPIGFTFLLRLVPPIGGLERIRLVPLLFSAGLAPLCYGLGRILDPTSRWRAWTLGFAGVLLPVSLRHDLKQYTTDAFCTLLVVLLVARVEREWSVRRLVALTSATCLAPLISHTSVLVSLLALGMLFCSLLMRRRWRQAVWTAGASALTAASFGIIYLIFDAPGRTSMLVHYWDPYYIPFDRGGASALSFVHTRWNVFLDQTGFRVHILAMLLLVFGCVVLFRLGQRAIASLLPLLLVESLVISSLKLYPLWDQRTSTYIVALATTVGVIGLVYGATLFTPHGSRRLSAVVPVLASLLVISVLARSSVDKWAGPIPLEDTRSAAAFISQHRNPGDVVLVDFNATYGFAFYWRGVQPVFVKTALNAVGFVPTFNPTAGIDVRTNPGLVGLDGDVQRSAHRAAGHTLWIVISHEQPGVIRAYLAAAARFGTTSIISNELISVAVP